MNPLTIASYNVQIPTVKTEDHNWERRKLQLLPSLHELGSIIALQEVSYVDQNQGEQISQALIKQGYDSYQPFHDEEEYQDEFHARVPIFWNSERFTWLKSGQRRLSTGTPEEQTLYPNMENRYCTFVQLQDVSNPELVYNIFNLHQQHVVLTDEPTIAHYNQVQADSMAQLTDFIQSSVSPGQPVFALGDFNMVHPKIDGLRCARVTAQEKINSQYDSYHGYRSPFPRGRKNIDHIHTSLKKKRILSYEACIQYAGSDHHPIRATFAE